MREVSSVVTADTVADDLSALEASAATANPYALRAAINAAAATGLNVSALMVRGPSGSVVGCWPFAIRRAWSGYRILKAPLVPLYDVSSAPLVSSESAAASVDASLRFLAGRRDLPRVLVFRNLQGDGPVWQALREAEDSGKISIDLLEQWERSLLDRSAAPDQEAYLAQSLSSGSRKRLRSKRRALEEQGKLALEIHSVSGTIKSAFERFTGLEVSGWKGRNGTALRQKPADAAYVLAVMEGLAANGRAFIIEMRQGERLIASGLFLRCRSEVFFWKTAYDNSLAKQSPGVVFDLMLTEWLYSQDWFERLDTGSDASVDPDTLIWKQRRPMVDAVISLDPGSFAGKAVVAGFRLRAVLKRLKARF